MESDELNASHKNREAEQKAAEERREMLTAVAREKTDYMDRLHKELDTIDKDLAELRFEPALTGKDGGHVFGNRPQKEIDKIQKLVTRRDLLRYDLDAIGRVVDHEWPTLKTRIDRDLGKDQPLVRPPRT